MAVTAALLYATPNELVYTLTHDGAAGDTLTIANSTLQTDAVDGGPVQEVLATAIANQAEARATMFGEGVPPGGSAGIYSPHLHVWFKNRNVVANVPAIDADVDAVTATLPELNITLAAAAAVYIMHIAIAHSLVS